jgi:GNAT superfamily N-acetyltransferase
MDYKIIIDDKKYDYKILENCKEMFEHMGLTKANFKDDFNEICFKLMENDRKSKKLKTIAILDNSNGLLIGHAICQMWQCPWFYQDALIGALDRIGYISALYVHQNYRRKGYGKIIMNACHDYLREIGCTNVLLHASDEGKYLYKSIDYSISNEFSYTL